MSKACDHPKAKQVDGLLRELIAEYELAFTVAEEQGDKEGMRNHRHTANRYWNALDSVVKA